VAAQGESADGMGAIARPAAPSGAAILVLTNAVIIDHSGIIRPRSHHRRRIRRLGKAGNHESSPGVDI